MKRELIFISSPYSSQSKNIINIRYQEVLDYTAYLMNRLEYCFSPIVHCHELSATRDLPGDWQYWKHYCEIMLERSQAMHILTLDGWRDSTGVQGEIELAQNLDIPIYLVNPLDYSDITELKIVR